MALILAFLEHNFVDYPTKQQFLLWFEVMSSAILKSMHFQVHRRLPQEYSNEDSPVAKRMRQSDGETEHGDEGDGGGVGGDEEDGWVQPAR